mgnify:CR=1 FL=1
MRAMTRAAFNGSSAAMMAGSLSLDEFTRFLLVLRAEQPADDDRSPTRGGAASMRRPVEVGPAPDPDPTRRWLATTVIALVAALFRLPGLGYPGEEYFDEVYHAKTALEYLRGQPPTEWVHPPTAKLLISIGVAAFGYEPWAWRLAPALAGTLLAPVFLLLAWQVLPTRRGALLATGLLLADGVYLVQSRVAMANVFAVLFQLLAALLLMTHQHEKRAQLHVLHLTAQDHAHVDCLSVLGNLADDFVVVPILANDGSIVHVVEEAHGRYAIRAERLSLAFHLTAGRETRTCQQQIAADK